LRKDGIGVGEKALNENSKGYVELHLIILLRSRILTIELVHSSQGQYVKTVKIQTGYFQRFIIICECNILVFWLPCLWSKPWKA
jgi:hypothetical protein